jgi:hypothetical protein
MASTRPVILRPPVSGVDAKVECLFAGGQLGSAGSGARC